MAHENEARTAGPGDARDADNAHAGPAAHISDSTKSPALEPGEAPDKASSSSIPQNLDASEETGESGETGVVAGGEQWEPVVSNGDFIAAIVGGRLPDGVFAAYCLKPGNPKTGGFDPRKWTPGDDPGAAVSVNAYVNCGAFEHGPDGSFRARVDRNAGILFLMLDDLGTKIPSKRLEGVTPTWLIETSPGNFQAGFAFTTLAASDIACRIHEGMIAAGLCDAGASQPRNRWARLPVAINGKPEYERDGRAFRCRLAEWNPQARFTPQELIEAFGLELPPGGPEKRHKKKARAKAGGPVFEQAGDDNAVIAALKSGELYKADLGDGRHDITCPWFDQHTEAQDDGTAYFEPTEEYPAGGFKCFHSHGDKLSIADLLEFLGVSAASAEGRALIRVTPGELWRVVVAAEELLAGRGDYFQRGEPGHIVRVIQRAGNAAISVCTEEGLGVALSQAARWERWDARQEAWAVCDPPLRHVKALWRGGNLPRLLPLDGLARQPFFAPGGELVCAPGYNAPAKRYGVFSAADFPFPAEFTRAAAEQALRLLQGLLGEFAFVSENDRAAAIGALLTAATRTSLPVAPAIHIRAPEFGSGKSYLAELIALFAGATAGGVARMSYPASGEEATKAILAALLAGPAAIIFDDMQSDWVPHGVINRMLTSEWISDRILGESRIAGASTRTLVLGTGNNTGVTGDLLRRVAVIHLDHGEERPATKSYRADPVKDVTRDRGRYVCAALTIIAAYRAAGAPKVNCKTLAGFGDWSDACRQPLLWLGLPDPAKSIFDGMAADQGRDAVAELLAVWFKTFGDKAITVRAAVKRAEHRPELLEAFEDIGAVERGEVNTRRLGWALSKAAGRICGGFKLSAADADGRKAWVVAKTDTKAKPAAPVSPVPPVLNPGPRVVAEYDDDDIKEVVSPSRAMKRVEL